MSPSTSSIPSQPSSESALETLYKAALDGRAEVFEEFLKNGEINSATPNVVVATISDLFRDRHPSLPKLDSRLIARWVNASYNNDVEKSARLGFLMMSASRLYPRRSGLLIDALLSLKAEPHRIFDEKVRPLGGIRTNMKSMNLTPFAYSIDNGHRDASLAMFKAVDKKVKMDPVAMVAFGGKSAVDENWVGLDAIGFAIACGQTEMFKAFLASLDFQDPRIQTCLGTTVENIVKLGLLDQGPDSVLGDVVTLIGKGADVSAFLSELNSKLILVDDGLDFTRSGSREALTFPAMITFATGYLPGASESDTVAALNALCVAGLDISQDVNPACKGARMIHYAAMADSTSLVSALLAHGATGLEVDAQGKKPIDYVSKSATDSRVKKLLSGHMALAAIEATPIFEAVRKAEVNEVNVVESNRRSEIFENLRTKQSALRR